MRCPPVTLTSGTLYFSATSAMRCSSAGVQTPPGISGMTEKVPSFWMLPCTRSLMKRASRSSTYSSFQIVISNDASAGLLAAILLAAAQRSEDRRTPTASSCSRTALISSGLVSGMPGT